MSVRIAINGFGRIGRSITRAIYESKLNDYIKLIAINGSGSAFTNQYLLKYDSIHGVFSQYVSHDDNKIIIDKDEILVYSERDPLNLPWKSLKIDLVIESTGSLNKSQKAGLHLTAGAKKVLICAPSDSTVPTVVYGINESIISKKDRIISGASCTTNCLAPLIKVLDDNFKFIRGSMLTVHSYTNDQKLIDNPHSDVRRGRAATHSIIPTKTGAASSIGLIMPNLIGKVDGYALRVPTPNVSAVDLSFNVKKSPDVTEINQAFLEASNGNFKNILGYNNELLVSIDFNHSKFSSIMDSTQTRKIESIYKVVAWYDNEWGFSNRMLDIVSCMI